MIVTLQLLPKIIIIITPVIPLMHGIYNSVPQTGPVPTLYIVTAVLYLHSALHVMLLSLLSPLRTVFTITYHKQALSLHYTLLQPFCIYSLRYM